VLGIITITGIILFQVFWVLKTFDLKEKQFNQTISIALFNVAERLAAFNNTVLPNESPVQQVSSTYFVVNVNSIIDAKILQNFLKTEFQYRDITIDYEYAIYDCTDDKMVYGEYVSNTPGKAEKYKSEVLPKYNKYLYYFGINFPTKTMYIVSNLDIWLISSLILLLTCIFFGYTIYTILKQSRLTEVQKDFINNITHEFKTPISTIAISSGVLLKPSIINEPERLHQYATIIQEQNKRLEKHVEDVLQIAMSERSKVKLVKEPVDLHGLLKQTSDSFIVSTEGKITKIELNLNASNPIISADRSQLTNVIYNLLDNAFKYSKDQLTIRISTETVERFVILTIEDNGIGINKKYIKKVFNKFYRVPSDSIHAVKGFGLGLSYVENIVKAHHWDIQLKSRENEGSKFIIKIPVKYE
jgi:two-component system, OmpR family, phosphate regulon sensor histidine kinase PhoR